MKTPLPPYLLPTKVITTNGRLHELLSPHYRGKYKVTIIEIEEYTGFDRRVFDNQVRHWKIGNGLEFLADSSGASKFDSCEAYLIVPKEKLTIKYQYPRPNPDEEIDCSP